MTVQRDTRLLEPADVRWVVAQAARAPSVHNTQPWHFAWDGERFTLTADTARALQVNDPEGRELVMSCGAALYNLRLALRKLGLMSRVETLPRTRPQTLAVVEVLPGSPADAEERRMFAALGRRHTHRAPFADRPLSPELTVRMQEAASEEGAQLFYVSDPGQRARILHLARAAERLLAGDEESQAEVRAWTAPPDSPRRDGVPAAAFHRDVTASAEALAARDFDLGREWGQIESPPSSAGPVAVLATDGDTALSWLTAGQALEHLLVVAAERSAYAALHSQAVEVPHIRSEIQRELCTSAVPQLLLRLGYADDTSTTPRRPVSDILEVQLP
jgi:hypothetical protein